MSTLYAILEVGNQATLEEIKGSYRRLAKLYHPDTNTEEARKNTRLFQKIQDAYAILSDPGQRLLYDQKELSKNGLNDPSWSKDSKNSFQSDSNVHASLSCSLKLTFIEACLGTKKFITLNGQKLEIAISSGIQHKSTLEITLETMSLKKIRVTFYVAPHPVLKRVGNHIYLHLPITLGESVSGGQIEVPTLYGSFMLKIPPYTPSGNEIILKGKGIPGKIPGDQYIKILVTLPEKNSESLQEILKNWEKSNPYNPRSF